MNTEDIQQNETPSTEYDKRYLVVFIATCLRPTAKAKIYRVQFYKTFYSSDLLRTILSWWIGHCLSLSPQSNKCPGSLYKKGFLIEVPVDTSSPVSGWDTFLFVPETGSLVLLKWIFANLYA